MKILSGGSVSSNLGMASLSGVIVACQRMLTSLSLWTQVAQVSVLSPLMVVLWQAAGLASKRHSLLLGVSFLPPWLRFARGLRPSLVCASSFLWTTLAPPLLATRATHGLLLFTSLFGSSINSPWLLTSHLSLNTCRVKLTNLLTSSRVSALLIPSVGLEVRMAQLIRGARADNTLASYGTAWRRYLDFCQACQFVSLPPVYATLRHHIGCFLTWLAGTLQTSTIEVYFNGIRAQVLNETDGLIDISNDFALSRLLQGIRRTFPSSPRQKLPVLPIHLVNILSRMDTRSVTDTRDWAIFTLSFFGFLRRSETAALRVSDITFNEGYVAVSVRSSKTSRTPVQILLAQRHDDLCPVRALQRYLAHVSPSVTLGQLPLFRAVVNGRLSTNGISKSTISARLKLWVHAIGLDAVSFSAHSLRRGGATAAAMAGIPDRLIKLHGRWASDAYLIYIREPLASRLSVSSQPLDLTGTVQWREFGGQV